MTKSELLAAFFSPRKEYPFTGELHYVVICEAEGEKKSMTKSELLAALIRLREEGEYRQCPYEGICGAIAYALQRCSTNDVSEPLCDAFCSWNKFSGDIVYPVPHEEMAPWEPYKLGSRLWPNEIDPPDSPNGRYQRLRVELLEHCIAWLSERIDVEKKT